MLSIDQVKDELLEIGQTYASYLREAEATHRSVYQTAGEDNLTKLQMRLAEAANAAEGQDVEAYNKAAMLYTAVSSALNERNYL